MDRLPEPYELSTNDPRSPRFRQSYIYSENTWESVGDCVDCGNTVYENESFLEIDDPEGIKEYVVVCSVCREYRKRIEANEFEKQSKDKLELGKVS